MSTEYLRGLADAKAVAQRHYDRAQKNVTECLAWSPAQAEWSRARDLASDISDEIGTLEAQGS